MPAVLASHLGRIFRPGAQAPQTHRLEQGTAAIFRSPHRLWRCTAELEKISSKSRLNLRTVQNSYFRWIVLEAVHGRSGKEAAVCRRLGTGPEQNHQAWACEGGARG